MVVRVFGIRHHGPGSARSLARALTAWAPEGKDLSRVYPEVTA